MLIQFWLELHNPTNYFAIHVDNKLFVLLLSLTDQFLEQYTSWSNAHVSTYENFLKILSPDKNGSTLKLFVLKCNSTVNFFDLLDFNTIYPSLNLRFSQVMSFSPHPLVFSAVHLIKCRQCG